MVETFMNLEHNPSILRVESTKGGHKNKLPPFLKIIREVTNEDTYETWYMAQEDYEMPEQDVIAIQESLLEERTKEPALLLAKINNAKNRPSSAVKRLQAEQSRAATTVVPSTSSMQNQNQQEASKSAENGMF